MTTHARIDIDHWIWQCPLADARATGQDRYVDHIYGPRDIAIFEQRRAEVDLEERGRSVPTDMCIWSRGEPENPLVTKIGGSPYRPTDAPWPVDWNNEPMGLLAQFNFTDSLDVLAPSVRRALPGDILLVFTRGSGLNGEWDPEDKGTWAMEWHRVTPGYAPKPAPRVLDLTPTFAALHRTVDFPDSEIEDNLDRVVGTKFGGAPFYIQDEEETPGEVLCTLASINPFGNPWPLLNVPTNPHGENYLDGNLLMLGDLGNAYFKLDRKGKVHWSVDCF